MAGISQRNADFLEWCRARGVWFKGLSRRSNGEAIESIGVPANNRSCPDEQEISLRDVSQGGGGGVARCEAELLCQETNTNLPSGPSAFMPTREQYAFITSCKVFFEQNPKVYLWTLTFREVQADWRAQRAFHEFIKKFMLLEGRLIRGLRVAELHKEHGIHYHMLVNVRMNIHIVRRLAKPFGFGRIGVKRCDAGTGMYLAKYLTKQDRIPNIKRWGSIGGQFTVKTKDVEIDSLFHRNRKEFLGPGRQSIQAIGACWRKTMIEGHHSEWRDFCFTVGRVDFIWIRGRGWVWGYKGEEKTHKISEETLRELLATWPTKKVDNTGDSGKIVIVE